VSQDLALFEPLFKLFESATTLTAEQRRFIQSLFTPRTFKKRQFFQRAGEVMNRGGFVARGCFRTYVIDESGTEGILHFSPEGTWIGDPPSILSGTPTLYFVDAIEPSTALVIDVPSFQKMHETIPELASGYRIGLERTAAGKQRRIALALHASAEERYEDFLRRQPALARRIPLRMLASYLGITPEALSRIRRRLGKIEPPGT
jgi:CRP-like cAMP-binding protein